MDPNALNTLYARQQSLNLSVPDSVWVVGCGGVGYWTAQTLGLAGVPKLYLFDGDRLSESNLNRIPYSADSVDQFKADLLAAEIKRLRPACMCLGFPIKFSPQVVESLLWPNWLVCTTDTHASRQMCSTWCREKGVSYLEAAAEGEFGSISGSPADFATDDEVNPGYASVPVWAGPVMAAGLLAGMHILHGATPHADVVRLGWQPEGVQFLCR